MWIAFMVHCCSHRHPQVYALPTMTDTGCPCFFASAATKPSDREGRFPHSNPSMTNPACWCSLKAARWPVRTNTRPQQPECHRAPASMAAAALDPRTSVLVVSKVRSAWPHFQQYHCMFLSVLGSCSVMLTDGTDTGCCHGWRPGRPVTRPVRGHNTSQGQLCDALM